MVLPCIEYQTLSSYLFIFILTGLFLPSVLQGQQAVNTGHDSEEP